MLPEAGFRYAAAGGAAAACFSFFFGLRTIFALPKLSQTISWSWEDKNAVGEGANHRRDGVPTLCKRVVVRYFGLFAITYGIRYVEFDGVLNHCPH